MNGCPRQNPAYRPAPATPRYRFSPRARPRPGSGGRRSRAVADPPRPADSSRRRPLFPTERIASEHRRPPEACGGDERLPSAASGRRAGSRPFPLIERAASQRRPLSTGRTAPAVPSGKGARPPVRAGPGLRTPRTHGLHGRNRRGHRWYPNNYLILNGLFGFSTDVAGDAGEIDARIFFGHCVNTSLFQKKLSLNMPVKWVKVEQNTTLESRESGGGHRV